MVRDSSIDLLPLSFTCKIHDSVAAHCSCTIRDCYICDMCVASGDHNHDSNEHYLISVSEKEILKLNLLKVAKIKQYVGSMISKIEEDVFCIHEWLNIISKSYFHPKRFTALRRKKKVY